MKVKLVDELQCSAVRSSEKCPFLSIAIIEDMSFTLNITKTHNSLEK